ncbi:hypothetical protein C9374_006498 [Naegleria lovaniensis]|uniref:SAM domain-containing protein n=1 Tax=Naegleria lovaniensis TaxID=51637 RepID=A0AA88GIC0_NAELO|nr:uncharacterized protein C9374_006498 [Naegleria lovaniensis]KAG2381509.1 hypothetical protein C9374_006498 [Naegleria lovaniensis]
MPRWLLSFIDLMGASSNLKPRWIAVIDVITKHQLNGELLLFITEDYLKLLQIPFGAIQSILIKLRNLVQTQIDQQILKPSDLPPENIFYACESQSPSISLCTNCDVKVMTDSAITFDSCQTNSSIDSSQPTLPAVPSYSGKTQGLEENEDYTCELATDEICQLSTLHKDHRQRCMKKIDKIAKILPSEEKEILCQNLIFPDRFMNNYLNRLPPSSLQSSKTQTDSSDCKIKIIVIEMNEIQTQRYNKRVGTSANFLFHSALIVGPWYMEWNDSSLVIPRPLTQIDSIIHDLQVFTLDICAIQDQKILDKLVTLCMSYNISKHYHFQHFIEQFLEFIEVKSEFDKLLQGHDFINFFFEQLRQQGVIRDVSLFMSASIREYILNSNSCSHELKELVSTQPYSETIISFHSHVLFDEYVNTILEQDASYFLLNHGKLEFEFLKKFDDMFWRHATKLTSSNPSSHVKMNCPFHQDEDFKK